MAPEISTEIAAYRALLEKLRSGSRTDLAIGNAGPNHADQLISAIIRSTGAELLMYARNMNGDVHGVPGSSFVRDLKEAVTDRKVKVRAMLSEAPDRLSDLLCVLGELKSGGADVQIAIAPKSFMERVAEKFNGTNYFTVGDGTMYRREYDPKEKIGVGNFNDPRVAGQLASLFKTGFPAA